MQRDTWRPIRQSGGAPCLWALDQPACDPPSAYKWSDDTDQWGPGPFCADLRLGSLHTRSVPHYHQNMSNPHKHHPYFTIHTPLLLLAFSYPPPPSRHPQVPRVEYGAPKMKREHLLYVSVGALLKTDCCLFLCSMLHARWKKRIQLNIIVHLFFIAFLRTQEYKCIFI